MKEKSYMETKLFSSPTSNECSSKRHLKYADKALHRAKLPLRVQVEEAGSWNETGCDPWSVRALKNTRMKRNQRIVNILYRIPISLKWEFSLNAHLHRDHSFISFYRGLSVPLTVNRLSYLCRSVDSSGLSQAHLTLIWEQFRMVTALTGLWPKLATAGRCCNYTVWL